MKRKLCAAGGALLAAFALLGFQTPDYQAEYRALQKQYNDATNAFYKPYQDAKTEEERNKVKLDFTKFPAKDFLPKFVELAERAKGTETAPEVWSFVMNLAPQAQKPDMVKTAVTELTTTYIKSPALEHAAQSIRYTQYYIGMNDAKGALRKIIAQSPHHKVVGAAMFSLAAMITEDEKSTKADRAEARRTFTNLRTKFADTSYAKQADAFLFQLDKLQIGQVAPDFSIEDENGKMFKLSDYRGKVVVLDFWGFW